MRFLYEISFCLIYVFYIITLLKSRHHTFLQSEILETKAKILFYKIYHFVSQSLPFCFTKCKEDAACFLRSSFLRKLDRRSENQG